MSEMNPIEREQKKKQLRGQALFRIYMNYLKNLKHSLKMSGHEALNFLLVNGKKLL